VNRSRIALDVASDLLYLGADDQDDSNNANETDGGDENEADDTGHEAGRCRQ
jgi:hypothetical protein